MWISRPNWPTLLALQGKTIFYFVFNKILSWLLLAVMARISIHCWDSRIAKSWNIWLSWPSHAEDSLWQWTPHITPSYYHSNIPQDNGLHYIEWQSGQMWKKVLMLLQNMFPCPAFCFSVLYWLSYLVSFSGLGPSWQTRKCAELRP